MLVVRVFVGREQVSSKQRLGRKKDVSKMAAPKAMANQLPSSWCDRPYSRNAPPKDHLTIRCAQINNRVSWVSFFIIGQFREVDKTGGWLLKIVFRL